MQTREISVVPLADDSALHSLMESAVDGMIIIDRRGIVRAANPAASRLFGYAAEDMIGRNVSLLMPSPHREEHDSYLERHIRTGERRIVGTMREVEGRRRDGSLFPLQLSVSIFYVAGAPFFTGILHDITDRKEQERALRQAHDEMEGRVQRRTAELQQVNERLQQEISWHRETASGLKLASKVFENASEAILITDAKVNIIQVNAAYLEITGYSAEEVVGVNPRLIRSGHHKPEFYKAMWQELHETGSWRGEIWDRRKNGDVYPQWLTINAVRDEHDTVTNYVGIFSDISNIKETEQRLEKLAYYDSLTELPNRKLFQDRLERELLTIQRYDRILAVLFIDLDRFKLVNDTLGHAAGDQLLVHVAKRINQCVRKSDTVARLGGDEFTVILDGIEKEEDAAHVARHIIDLLQNPFDLSGQEAYIGASIGIGIAPVDGIDFGTLTRNADIAMYQAKKAGRGQYTFYSAEMNAWTHHRFTLEGQLKRAVDHKQFQLHYQPKVDHNTGLIKGMEALIRWHHPDEGWISPVTFIPLAEETGLIVELGEWVLQEACCQLKQLHQAGFEDLRMAVNLSAVQFRHPELIPSIDKILKKCSVSPEDVELEITESMVMGNVEKAIHTLAELRGIGFRLAIDDFGTGYSSLSYLKRFPIQTLKIDRSFIADLTEDSDDAAIVTAIISLAESLDLEVVAEGVETAEQLAFLREKGCGLIQGYGYSPPVRADLLMQLLKKGPLADPE